MSLLIGFVLGIAVQTSWMTVCDRRGWDRAWQIALGIPIAAVISMMLHALWQVAL